MLTQFALFTAVAGTFVYAAPFAPSSKHATHRRLELRSGIELEAYQPPSTFETFGDGITHPLHKRADATPAEAAAAFIESRLNIEPSDISVRKAWTGTAEVAHVYAKQVINSVPVANAVANVAINKEDRIVAFGSSFVKPASIAPAEAKISEKEAIEAAEQALGGTRVDHPVSLEYVITPSDAAVLTYVVQVETDPAAEDYHWYEGFIDAATGKLVTVTDFTANAAYRVVPIENQDPTTGFSDLADPQDVSASPQGWHNGGTVTSGNNVIASKAGATISESAPGEYFYDFDATQQPTVAINVAAATVNAFYTANTIHDYAYRYGFTEAAFNFQSDNFGLGGTGNDRVIVSVQDSSGTNNAAFSTPADGQSGTMRMFRWTLTTPGRDGDLENDIIVHEFTHGISNRLTGGGTARCLQTTESRGMGEGWSDANAEWSETKSATVTDFTLGNYVTNRAGGIRTHPYSTSTATNPLTYASIGSLGEVHAIGEVWANILHQVYAALVEQYGWSPTAKTNPDGAEGNIVYFHLFIDQLALQPCNPTVLNARDAWIQADVNRYGGVNRCLLWKAFASRGLGTEAVAFVDSATVPDDCA